MVYVKEDGAYNLNNKDVMFISIPKEIAYRGNVCGVYMISIGDHFYIGKSVNIISRATMHVVEFQSLIKIGSKRYGKRKKIFKYLSDNPNLHIFHLTVLVECGKDELDYVERFFIKQYGADKKSLNTQIYGKI